MLGNLFEDCMSFKCVEQFYFFFLFFLWYLKEFEEYLRNLFIWNKLQCHIYVSFQENKILDGKLHVFEGFFFAFLLF